jgi:membrane protein
MSGMRVQIHPERIPGLVFETARRLGSDRILEMSAALAFYSALSLAPLLVIAMGVAGMVVDKKQLESHLADEVNRVLGHGAGDLVKSLAAEQAASGAGTWATVVGVGALMLAATAVFGQLKDGLDRIWGERAQPRSGLWLFVRKRLLTLAMVLGVGFLLLTSLLLSASLSMIADFAARLGLDGARGAVLHLASSLILSTLLFGLVFKVLPEAEVKWGEAWAGGVFTSILFHLGGWGIGAYLGRASIGSPYGAAGTLLVLLVWVYYSSVIVFGGALFTNVCALRYRARAPRAVDPPRGGLPE